MLIIPAIDLLGGTAVRLARGEYATACRYADDPGDVARLFRDQGAAAIHVVDLDAARGKGADNRGAIARIRAAAPAVKIEVGGGVRSVADAEALASLGADRLVVGTVLARSPDIVAEMAERFGRMLVGGIDARDGRVKVSGWESDAGIADENLAVAARRLGLRGLVYTSILRDGMLSGPDVEGTNRVAAACGLPTVLSGGIGSEQDVRGAVEGGSPLIVGIIVGKAIYEGAVSLARLVEAFQKDDVPDW